MTCHTTERARDKAFEQRKGQPWQSHKAMMHDIAQALYRMGEAVVLAQYDGGGNCILCGEAGKCAGVHTVSEWQRAETGVM